MSVQGVIRPFVTQVEERVNRANKSCKSVEEANNKHERKRGKCLIKSCKGDKPAVRNFL